MRLNPLPSNYELGWAPYVWLVYSVPMGVYAFLHPIPAMRFFLIAAMMVFLAFYFRGYWVKDWGLVPVLLGLVCLGFMLSFFHFAGSVFYIYAAGFLGGFGSKNRAFAALLVIVAICIGQAAWFHFPLMHWIIPPAICFVVGAPNIHFGERDRIRQALIESEREVAELARMAVRDEERDRIARDLHDLLGHSLSSIALKSQLIGKLIERDPEMAAREAREIEDEARKALQETRKAISGWRFRELDGELQRGQKTLAAAGVACKIEVPPDRPEPRLETTMALLVREAVTNVLRHAQARSCAIKLVQNGRWELQISDDGVGIQQPPGFGMEGMRARTESMGGEMDCVEREGTHLRFRFPLGEPT